jgi:sigma-B regulation protein RsbU (phosphoserine phosphatase)
MSRTPSIRVIVALLMAGPVIVIAGLLVVLSSVTAHRIAEDLGAQLVDHATATVQRDTREYLASAVRISDLYARRLARGELATTNLREWEPVMLDDLATTPDVASICFGNAAGDSTWLLRHAGRLEVGRVNGAAGSGGANNAEEYVMDPVTGVVDLDRPIRQYHYDPRARPWYATALANSRPTWTPIYFWFGDAGGDLETGTGYTRAIIHAKSADVAGVLVIDVTLGALSGFLKRLPLANLGSIFVVDSDGHLVASSRGPVNSKDGDRLSLRDNGDPAAIAAADAMAAGATTRPAREIPDRIWVSGEEDESGWARLRTTAFSPHAGLDWHIITVIPERAFLADARSVQRRAIVMGIVAAIGALALGLLLSRSMANPILSLREHVKRIGTGDFESRLHLRAARELRDLSQDLNQMAGDLKERMELRQSLALATEVQQSLLPHAPPKLPGLDIAGQSKYCDTTGGDYFDFIDIAELPARQTLVAVGDVMGHGIASALLMATARAALRATALKEGSLATLMTRVNEVLSRDARHNRFMTMDLAVVDPQAGTLRWASAGHDPPMIYSPVREAFREVEGGDIPLGLSSGVDYEEYRVDEIEPGSIIVIGTDGIWEAPNAQKELFGKERLCEVIRTHARDTAEGISAAINKALAGFCGQNRYPDDVTFVVIKMWVVQ